MIEINLRIDKELNFLMIIYQFLKLQNNFNELNFKHFNFFKKEDTKIIKKFLRGEKISLDDVFKNPRFRKFYELNKDNWDRYWKENEKKLIKIKEKMNKRISNYNFDIFKKVEKFFEKKIPKEIDFWIFMGNEKDVGTGNAFREKYVSLFPRNFKNYSNLNLEKDFAIFIHEVVHLFQSNSCERKEEVEFIAQCFAPRGILINLNKVRFKGLNLEKFKIVKNGFKSKKSFREVEKELKNFNNLYSKKETQIKFSGGKNDI